MSGLVAVLLGFPLRHFTPRDVERNALQPNRLMITVQFEAALTRDPAYLTVGQYHAVFRLVVAISLAYVLQSLARRFTIAGMKPL